MTTIAQDRQDPVDQYAATVSTLKDKVGKVVLNQQAVADSLSRAAAALRSIGAARAAK